MSRRRRGIPGVRSCSVRPLGEHPQTLRQPGSTLRLDTSGAFEHETRGFGSWIPCFGEPSLPITERSDCREQCSARRPTRAASPASLGAATDSASAKAVFISSSLRQKSRQGLGLGSDSLRRRKTLALWSIGVRQHVISGTQQPIERSLRALHRVRQNGASCGIRRAAVRTIRILEDGLSVPSDQRGRAWQIECG